jgi:hypothetical protein
MEERFFFDGYCVVSSCVPDLSINNALRLINKMMEKGAEKKEFCPESAVTDLFNESPKVKEAVGLLLGLETAKIPFMFAAQIALRFPGTLCDELFNPVPFWRSLWHIDGLPSPENGVAIGTIKVYRNQKEFSHGFVAELIFKQRILLF